MSTLRSPISSRMKLNVTELSERAAGTDFRDMVMTPQMKALLANPKFRLFSTNVLVATYVKPRKTAGGILLPETSVHEDRWQAKVGLVLKLGETAFHYDGQFEYKGYVPEVGDYITFHTSDTRETGLLGFSCRYIDSALVRGTVPDPDAVY